MTLNDSYLENPTCRTPVWLTRYSYPQNIPGTTASLVNEWRQNAPCGVIASHRTCRGAVKEMDQTACKPGSVPPGAETPDLGDHSSGPPLAGRFSRPTRTAQAYDSPALIAEGSRSLFGLAPGGACHAVPVTSDAVGSYPTLSPFPLRREEVCFLWRYPWGRPRRALPAAMSSWSPDFPRPPCESRDRPAVWSARKVVAGGGEVKLASPLPRGEAREGEVGRGRLGHAAPQKVEQASARPSPYLSLSLRGGEELSTLPMARSSSTVPSLSRTRRGKRPSTTKPRRS